MSSIATPLDGERTLSILFPIELQTFIWLSAVNSPSPNKPGWSQ